MAHAVIGFKKSVRKSKKRRRDAFREDEIQEGEYETPGPRIDPDAARIAAMLSEIKKRQGPSGFVLNWSPQWLKRANAVANEQAVKTLAEARKELSEAKDDKERSQGNMRVQMASETVRNTQLALQSGPDAGAFGFYFLDDKLAIYIFDSEEGDDREMDAMSLGMTPAHQIEAGLKTSLCSKRGILYIALGPDDELDKVQLAAKLGVLTVRKGEQSARMAAKTRDGITEEEIV